MYLSICYDRNDQIIVKLYSLNFPSRKWYPDDCIKVKIGLSSKNYEKLSYNDNSVISGICADVNNTESWLALKEQFR